MRCDTSKNEGGKKSGFITCVCKFYFIWLCSSACDFGEFMKALSIQEFLERNPPQSEKELEQLKPFHKPPFKCGTDLVTDWAALLELCFKRNQTKKQCECWFIQEGAKILDEPSPDPF